MEMLPILSKAQMLYENDVMCNAISIEDILPLINRWLVEYRDLMNEDFNQLHLVTQKSIETKYLIAQRISALFEEIQRLLQVIERNRAASSTSSQTTNADDTGSTSSGSSTSEKALPNIVASPKPADQLNDDKPSTSRSALRNINTVRRITYENAYCADPRKRVLREMNGEANLSGISNETVATTTETASTASTNSAESVGAASMSTPTPAPLPPMPMPSPPNHH
uniref:Uncharacterized protein n=1 Tax=Zeugodacus cucurbitae TaxID=28588 RepID=A0A0A1WS12_ZEUCU